MLAGQPSTYLLRQMRAAVALERFWQAAAAEMIYANGAERWPENWVWPFGLGNARYQRGDLRNALRAFERAMAIGPVNS